MVEIDMEFLKRIIREDLAGDGGISSPPFSPENVVIIVDGTEEPIGDWEKEVSELDVEDITDGEWSLTEPDDGDYGSIVLEQGTDMVTDDFGLADKSRHRFKKKF